MGKKEKKIKKKIQECGRLRLLLRVYRASEEEEGLQVKGVNLFLFKAK